MDQETTIPLENTPKFNKRPSLSDDDSNSTKSTSSTQNASPNSIKSASHESIRSESSSTE